MDAGRAGAPWQRSSFISVPVMRSPVGIMIAILLTNLSMAILHAPTIALLGDLGPSSQRSTANGVMNLMGGLGAIAAFLIGEFLYSLGHVAPFVFGCRGHAVGGHGGAATRPRAAGPPGNDEGEKAGGFFANLGEVLRAPDRSGVLILLAIMCWFIGYNALETWISSFGKFTLGNRRGAHVHPELRPGIDFMIFAVPCQGCWQLASVSATLS